MSVKEFPDHIQKILDYLMQFPGIGPRSAFRIVSHLLHMQDESLKDFGSIIGGLKEKIGFCKNCFNIAEKDLCLVCDNSSRDNSLILVVEDILDLVAFERAQDYKGVYHVLGGVISPLRGIGPGDIRLKEFFVRLEKNSKNISEVIIATNPNLEGEATAMYIKNELQKWPTISVTRIARGIPTGAEIDFADDATLQQALNRRSGY